ncbi:MAG: hypothetical protein IJA34_16360 [Lachnospiraceae bacterium]|nr:hypothetical protein [Lachnospiraceae bacterium]
MSDINVMTNVSIDCVSAVDEFVKYGQIDSLKNYFELSFSQSKITNESVKMDIEKCLNKLDNIINDLHLCRTGLIMEHFYRTEDNIYVLLNNFIKCYEESDDATAKAFVYVAINILKEFEPLYDCKDLEECLKAGQLIKNSLPRIIKWCLEKNYIQQAITLCLEQIPKYLIESGKVVVSDKMWEYMIPKINNKYEKNYYLLVKGLREYDDKILKNIKGILIKEKTSLNNPSCSNKFQIIVDKDNSIKYYANEITKDNDMSEFLSGKDNVMHLLNNIIDSLMTNAIYSDKKLNKYTKEVEEFNKCIEGKYNINKWINESMINLNWSNFKFSLSDKKNATVFTLVKGKDDDNEPNINVKDNADRSKRFFEDKAILNAYYDAIVVKEKFIVEEVFNDLFNELFGTDTNHDLRNKYIKEVENCSKYDYSVYFDNKKVMIGTDLQAEKIRKIFYLYGMCKEQKNYSNHANSEGESVVLDANKLKILIKYLIEEL